MLPDATPATFETPERQTPAPEGSTDHTKRTDDPSQTEKEGDEGPTSNPEPVKSRFYVCLILIPVCFKTFWKCFGVFNVLRILIHVQKVFTLNP